MITVRRVVTNETTFLAKETVHNTLDSTMIDRNNLRIYIHDKFITI